MKIIFSTFFRIILGFISVLVVYFLVSLILSAIPVNKEPSSKNDVTVFLLTNGVHSDFVVPVKNHVKDWSNQIRFEHTKSKDTTYRYVAFGWGDKAFYLETPTWSDLKFKTAFNAVFGLGPSAIHATFFRSLQENEDCVKLNLSTEQYQKLADYIEKSLEKDGEGNVIPIKTDATYEINDAFYESCGRYNLFKTCNSWTNTGLKVCGQKACVWTPFDWGIFWHYRKK